MIDKINRRAGGIFNQRGWPDGAIWGSDIVNLAALGVFPFDLNSALAIAADTSKSAVPVQQIVFIEADVPDARQLATGVAPGVLAVVLDPEKDGVAQMAAFLAQHRIANLSAVDIVAHGADGSVALGSATLGLGTLTQYRSELAAIGAALRPGGAIQIYGCDVAQDAGGVAFLDQLSAATRGASVAAASHLVGSAAGGGSWDLNVDTGPVSATAPFTAGTEASYRGELATGFVYYALSDGNSAATSSGDAIVRMNADGTGSTTIASGFTNFITGMALDSADNTMFVLDNTGFVSGSATGNTIWSVNLSTGTATNIFTGKNIGNNNGVSVTLGAEVAYDTANGLVYFMEGATSTGTTLMSMTRSGGNLTAVTSSAVSTAASGLAIDTTDNRAFVLDSTASDRDIFSVNLATGAATKIYQNVGAGIMGLGVAYDPADGDVYFVQNLTLFEIPASTSTTLSSATQVATSVEGSSVGLFSIDPTDGFAYIRGITSSVTQYNQVNLSTGAVTKILAEPSGQLTGDSAVFAICFCAGTLVCTPAGQVLVQDLKVGDEVQTMDNGPRPIRWIGKGKVLATRGRRTAATPVIVCKGALADNIPTHDLRVTKGHAFYIDGVLIPAEFLVNHKTILWDDRAQEVEIYHIELDSHDVLLANGALAESYRDDGNRWLFQNANEGWRLPPQESYAPVLTGGPIVDGVWQRLLNRAGPRTLPPVTDDPDLHLLVDGRRLNAAWRSESLYVFRLATRPASARVVSRAGAPQELGLARDPRSLGVALRQIMVAHGARLRVVDAADARLADGFHGFEADNHIRWTDGDATILADLFDGFVGPFEVALHLAGKASYVDDGVALRIA
jgi:hypothetical protein